MTRPRPPRSLPLIDARQQAARVGWIDPQEARVGAAGRAPEGGDVLPAVDGAVHRRAHQIHDVGTLRIGVDLSARAGQFAAARDPCIAAIVGAIQSAAAGTAPGAASAADSRDRVEPSPMRAGCQRERRDARAVGQTARRDRLPRRSAVGRAVDAGARPRRQDRVGHLRIAVVEKDVRCARRSVGWQHTRPRPSAVGGAIDAAFHRLWRRLRCGGGGSRAGRAGGGSLPRSHRRDQQRVGVARIDRDAADVLRSGESGAGPRAAGVRRLVDTLPRGERPSRLIAGSDVDDGVIRRRDGHGADRRNVHGVENRLPRRARVRRLPHAPFGQPGVIGRRVTRDARRGGHVP